jgi:hypothetical protein
MTQAVKSLWASVQGDPVFMAPSKRLADHLLDRHDPGVHRDGMDQQRHLRRGVVALGARLRALGQPGELLESTSIKRRRPSGGTRLTFLVRPLNASSSRRTWSAAFLIPVLRLLGRDRRQSVRRAQSWPSCRPRGLLLQELQSSIGRVVF